MLLSGLWELFSKLLIFRSALFGAMYKQPLVLVTSFSFPSRMLDECFLHLLFHSLIQNFRFSFPILVARIAGIGCTWVPSEIILVYIIAK